MDYSKWSKLDRELEEEEKEEAHARSEQEACQSQAQHTQAPSVDPFGDRFAQSLQKAARGPLVNVLREVNNPEYPVCDFGTRMGIMLQLDTAWGNGLLRNDCEYTIFAPSDPAMANFRCENPKIESKQLMCILGFHIVEGKIWSADLRAQLLPELVTTPSGKVARDAYMITLANLDEDCRDIEHPNFVLHAIDKVLLPPPEFIPLSEGSEETQEGGSKPAQATEQIEVYQAVVLGREPHSIVERSGLGFGCMNQVPGCYGPGLSDEAAAELLRGIYDAGCRHFDTAEVYKAGNDMDPSEEGVVHNERTLALFFRTVPRNSFTVASKYWPGAHQDASGEPATDYATLKASCEESLKRLGLRCIDIYYCHRVPSKAFAVTFMLHARRLVEEGLVRCVGLCEICADWLRAAHQVHPVACVQSEWSLVSRQLEAELIPCCKELHVAVVAFSPLSRGLLAHVSPPTDGDVRCGFPRFAKGNYQHNRKLVEQVQVIAERRGLTAAQLSLAWLLHRAKEMGVVCLPIPGTTKLANAKANLAAVGVQLTTQEAEELEALGREVVGLRFAEGGMKMVMESQEEGVQTEEQRAEEKRRKEEERNRKAQEQAAQQNAQALKAAGTVRYKARDFEGALRHYHQALDLDTHNALLHANIAAVHLEAKAYDMSAHWCKLGLEQAQLLQRAREVEYQAQQVEKQVQEVLRSGKVKRRPQVKQRSPSMQELDVMAKLHARWALALQRQASAVSTAAKAGSIDETCEMLKGAEAHCRSSLDLVKDSKVLQRLGSVQKAREVQRKRKEQEERLKRRARKEAKQAAQKKREEELRAKGREVLEQRGAEGGGAGEGAGGAPEHETHETSEQHLQRAMRSDEARALVRDADRAFGEGQLEEAVKLYERAESKANGREGKGGAGDLIPQFETMLICRAMARSQLGQKKEALADCNKSIAYRPSFDALVTKADVLEDMGGAKQAGEVPVRRMRQCVEALLEAHEMDPSATIEAQLHQRLYTTFIKLVYREKSTGESADESLGKQERKDREATARKIMAEPEVGALLHGLGNRPLGEVLQELQPVNEGPKGGVGKEKKKKRQQANVRAIASLAKVARLYLWGMLSASNPLDRQKEQQQVREIQQHQVETAAKEEQRALDGISMEWWGKNPKGKQQQQKQPQRAPPPPPQGLAQAANVATANMFAPQKLSVGEAKRIAQEQEQQQKMRQQRLHQQQQSSTVNALGSNLHTEAASLNVPLNGPRYGYSERAAQVMEEYRQRKNVLPKADDGNGQVFGGDMPWPCLAGDGEGDGDQTRGSGGGSGGGSVLEMLSWSQTVRDVTLRLRLRPSDAAGEEPTVTSTSEAATASLRKSLKCSLLPTAITIAAKQLQQQLHLFDDIKATDSTWFLEEAADQGREGGLLVQLHLEKGRQEYWPCAFDGAPCVDVADCQLNETHLDDLADGNPLLKAVGGRN
jgi:aryl-alcohol dehydrogenase-like predicted oxidoreductase